MAKRKIVYSETYNKGVTADKNAVFKLLNQDNIVLFAIKSGVYDDGKEFLTVMIDDINANETRRNI